MAWTLKKDDLVVGTKMECIENGAQVLTNVRDHGTAYNVRIGEYFILTGYYYNDGKYVNTYETTSGFWIPIDFLEGNGKKWKSTEKAENVKTYSDAQAQSLVNKIIECDKHIISNNLLCARFAHKFTPAQRDKICELQRNLMERENALIKDGFVEVKETSYPAGYVELEPYLDSLMNGEPIGIATWAVIVIVAVVVASMGTAAYYAYKWYADQAEQDVKFSDELTKILQEKLTPEEYEQLRQETKGIVTKARIKQTLQTGSAVWLWAAAAIGGLYIYLKATKKI